MYTLFMHLHIPFLFYTLIGSLSNDSGYVRPD